MGGRVREGGWGESGAAPRCWLALAPGGTLDSCLHSRRSTRPGVAPWRRSCSGRGETTAWQRHQNSARCSGAGASGSAPARHADAAGPESGNKGAKRCVCVGVCVWGGGTTRRSLKHRWRRPEPALHAWQRRRAPRAPRLLPRHTRAHCRRTCKRSASAMKASCSAAVRSSWISFAATSSPR